MGETRASPTAETRASCCEKYRRIFELRNRTQDDAVAALIELFHSTASVLLRHEAVYALGQMQRSEAVPFLTSVLEDGDEHPITRHEAGEALGAIEAPESLEILRRHAADAASEVSDTCGLALDQLKYKIFKGTCGCERRPQEALRLEGGEVAEKTAPYSYVTPAPAAQPAPVPVLRSQLLDESLPLFDRYRALFALRDAVPEEGEDAVLALCAAFEDGNALLKHEVAFVLGQLEHVASVPALSAAVRSEEEHPMVRHEAAEALGAIGTAEATSVLRDHVSHPEDILRESCWVALQWVE